MFINNRAALSEQTIRAPIHKDDIELTHVTQIRVSKDGGRKVGSVSDELKTVLAASTTGHYSITLSNSDPKNKRAVEANYVVRIKIATQSDLDAIDEHFIRMLAVDDVRMSDLRRFSDTCASYPGADEYASALGVYVTGVLIKDQNAASGVSRPLSDYKDKMQQALETLHDFDRPVARAICASIKFNLNDFRTPPLPSGAELLDAANELFSGAVRGLAVQPTYTDDSLTGQLELPACPIDRDSYDLLGVLRKVLTDNVDASLVGELSASAVGRRLSDYDISKLRVLGALAAIQAEDTQALGPILQDLANDPVFGRWAEAQLAGKG